MLRLDGEDERTEMLIVHRDLPGKHIEEGVSCWCNPVAVDGDDLRTTEQIVEATKVAEA